jgi:uncharacterized protein YjbI with pentapeptide repeats
MKQAVERQPRDIRRPVKLWAFPAALAGVVLTGLMVFSLAAYGMWANLGSPDLRGYAGWQAKDTLDLVRIALIVTGGLGGVVALVVAYRRQRLAEDTNRREEDANHRAELASRRDDTKLFNERFTAANAQLGNESAAVRLGAVYAMAGLADDWEAGRRTCIDVLCAYLRMPYQADQATPGWKEGEREVRLSVISIIRRHLCLDPEIDARSWQGHDLDFTGATFDGADFSDAAFTGGTVSFKQANFIGGNTRFYGVKFAGADVEFDEATFTDGRVSFNQSTFSGGDVSFDKATFDGSAVSFALVEFTGGAVGFEHAVLSGGDIRFQANFSGSYVSFDEAVFAAGTISFALSEFSANTVSFMWAKFRGSRISFQAANFCGGVVDLSGIELTGVPPIFSEFESPPDGLQLPNDPDEADEADGASDSELAQQAAQWRYRARGHTRMDMPPALP